MNPIVSVCMITYGHGEVIGQAIESVLNQKTRFKLELIVLDDCSPDNTRDIVKDIENRHTNGCWIKYTRHELNKGMMPSFNWALEQCRGKYIALCDGDDYWTDPLKLQKQVDFMEANSEYHVCFHRTWLVDGEGKKLRISQEMDRPMDIGVKDFFEKNPVGANTSSALLRRANLWEGGPPPEYFLKVVVGDYFLWLELLRHGKGRLLPDIMGAYRVGEGVWSKKSKAVKLLSHYRILNELDRYIFKGTNGELEKALVKSYQKCQKYIEHQGKELEEMRSSFTYRMRKVLYAPFLWIQKAVGLKN